MKIYSVAFQFHDYEIEMFLIDALKLDASNPLEKAVLKKISKAGKSTPYYVNFNADGDGESLRLSNCRHDVLPCEIQGMIRISVNFE